MQPTTSTTFTAAEFAAEYFPGLLQTHGDTEFAQDVATAAKLSAAFGVVGEVREGGEVAYPAILWAAVYPEVRP